VASYTDYSLSVATAATERPITATEAKLWCRIDTATEDTIVDSLIKLATDEAEALSGRALVSRTYDLTLDQWQLGMDADVIKLPYPPTVSVTSVKYTTAAGVLTTLAATEYTLVTATTPAYLVPAIGTTWPTDLRDFSPIVIRYVAGYGAATAVPDAYKRLVAALVGLDWEARDDMTPGNLRSRENLIKRLRMDWGYA
jgi:uncharacterized phiE125 gp8 family phage protein